jgi:diadenosine tetraphosphate (Ap4A) HIT family hydrolase
MTTAPGCRICDLNARFDQGALPLRERIAHDASWRVACASVALPGWLVLVSRRHVPAVAQLSDGEAAALGAWHVGLSRALQEATGCSRTYIACYAEREGFRHVHFHIVPRPDGLPAALHGPGIFELLKPEAAPADPGHIDQIAETLHQLLRR